MLCQCNGCVSTLCCPHRKTYGARHGSPRHGCGPMFEHKSNLATQVVIERVLFLSQHNAVCILHGGGSVGLHAGRFHRSCQNVLVCSFMA